MPPTELIARLPTDQLGGARVFRPCTIAAKPRRSGDVLFAEELAAIPKAALRALIDQRYLVPWPRPTDAPLAAPEDAEAHVYNRVGTSTYDVILGRKVNGRPLSKADAEALADRYRKPAAA